MKKIIIKTSFIGSVILMSSVVFAAPTDMKLASPTSIEVKSKSIILEFMLPCVKKNVMDTAKIVMTSDDSGDLAASVGLVYSESARECEKSAAMKKFSIRVNPAIYGYPVEDTAGGFKPMALAE